MAGAAQPEPGERLAHRPTRGDGEQPLALGDGERKRR
jgi:hypothetical protein